MARSRRRAYTRKDISDWGKQLTTQVEAVSDDLQERTEEALELIMEKADEYVPEDTGLTKDSAYFEVTKESGRIKAIFGYDKFDRVPYINIIYYNVKGVTWRKAGAKDQWLDEAFRETKDEAYDIIAGKK